MTGPGYTNVVNGNGGGGVVLTVPATLRVDGVFVYDETSALEQVVYTLALVGRAIVGSIWIDMVNVTQDSTIRLYTQIDGVNYRLFQENAWVVADEDGVLLDGFVAPDNIQITIQCGGAGIGNVNVPYAIV